MDLLDKLRAVAGRVTAVPPGHPVPLRTVVDGGQADFEGAVDGRPTLLFGSNNYLGLSHHPDVVAAAARALAAWGTGTTGSRIANGTLPMHVDLEAAFADLFGARQALVFTTGYQANLAVVGTVCGPDDVILIDAESHASLVDAARLSRATVIWFRHNDVDNLRAKLARLPAGATNRLVIVEGVYSIGGDMAPLVPILDVCRQMGAYLLVDEAHAFGVVGPTGLGCAEAQGVVAEVDFIVGTFSKSLGGVGGFAVSRHAELEALRYAARPYLFTAAGAPATVAGAAAALEVMRREPARRERFWRNLRQMRAGLQAAGLSIGATESPIVAIATGDEVSTYFTWKELLDAGLYVNIVLPPGCPRDACLLRASVSAGHTAEQVAQAIDILRAVGRRRGLAGPPAQSAFSNTR